jgi:lysozyme
MQMSEHGLDLLTEWEGSRSRAYKDAAGLLTIGVGHQLTKSELTSGKINTGWERVSWRDGLNGWQITDLLASDVYECEDCVTRAVVSPLEQHQFDCLVSFTFNVGNEAFTTSTLLKELNRGRYDQVPLQLARWVYSGGRRIQGLANRRAQEALLWQGRL